MSRGIVGIAAAIVFALGCAKSERLSVVDLVKEVSSEARTKAQVKVSIHLAADQPTPQDEALLRSIEDAISRKNVGRLVNSGSEPGYVFVIVEVEKTADAIAKLRSILLDAGALKRSSFKVIVPE